MLRVGKSKLKALAAAATLAAPAISMAQTNGTWTFAGNGNWSVVGNWVSNASPASGAGTLANFGGYASLWATPTSTGSLNTITNINMDAARTIGRIDFVQNGAATFGPSGGYAITGASVISLANLNGDIVTLNADGGTHRISAPITGIGSTFVTKTGAGTIVLSGTTNNFNTNALGINDGTVVAAAAGATNGLVAIATANGAVFQIGDGGAGNAGAMGAKTIGLGAIGAPNGTIRVANGTGNTMTGNWFVVATGTLNAAAGSNLSIAGNIFDSLDNTLNGFTKAGTGSFTANGMVLNGSLNQLAGDFILTGAATLATSSVGTANITGGNLIMTGGTFTSNNIKVNGGNLTVTGPARIIGTTTLTTGQMTLNAATHTGNITIAGGTFTSNGGTVNSIVAVNGGSALFNKVTASTLSINGGTARAVQQGIANDPNGVVRVNALTIAAGKALDLNNNSMIIDYSGPSPLATIKALLLSGRGAPGFGAETWDGPGIRSGTLNNLVTIQGDFGFSIGYANNGDLPFGAFTNFAGQTVDDTSILLKFTRSADVNLDGIVDDLDVTVIYGFYGDTSGEWSLGDVDYSGIVDDGDVTLVGAFYDPSAPALSPDFLTANYGSHFADVFLAAQALGPAAVPEPASLGLLAMAGGLLLSSRRRRV